MYRIGNAHLYCDYHDLGGLDDVDVNSSTVLKFYHIEIHNSLYYCDKYKRATFTNNHTVLYQDPDDKFAVVCYYLELNSDDGSSKVVAVVKQLNTSFRQGSIIVHHLHEVISEGSVVRIPVEWIKEKCVFIKLDSMIYVAKIYNHHKLTL